MPINPLIRWTLNRRILWLSFVALIIALAWLTRAEGDLAATDQVGGSSAWETDPSRPRIAFSPDGRLFASGTDSDAVSLIDLSTGGQQILTSDFPSDPVSALAFSGDGEILAAAGAERILLWNTGTGEVESWLGGGFATAVTRLSLDEKGDVLAAGIGGAEVLVWSSATGGQRRLTLGSGTVTGVLMSADGKRLASSDDSGDVRVHDLETDAETRLSGFTADAAVVTLAFTPDGGTLVGRDDAGEVAIWNLTSDKTTILPPGTSNQGLAVSPDGSRLAASGADGLVRLWDLSSGKKLTVAPQTNGAESRLLTFSPSGDLLASVDQDDLVWVWDLQTGVSRDVLMGPATRIVGLAVTAQDDRVAGLAETGELVLWDRASGGSQSFFLAGFGGTGTQGDGSVTGTAGSGAASQSASQADPKTSPVTIATSGSAESAGTVTDSSAAVSASNPSTRPNSWNSRRGVRHWRGMTAVAVSADGSRIGTTEEGGAVRLWDSSLRELRATSRRPSRSGATSPTTAVAFTSDGSRMVSVGADTVIRWSDAKTGSKILRSFGPEHPTRAVAASPTTNLVATGGEETRIMLWNGDTGKLENIFNAHKDFVSALAFSHDGSTLASGGVDGEILLWTTASGAVRDRLPTGAGQVDALAFRPDGVVLASAGSDLAIRVWDVASGNLTRSLTGHEAVVRALAFSPADEHRLASADDSGQIRIWDSSTGKLLGTLSSGRKAINALVFRPDGTLLSADELGRLTLWDTTRLRRIKTVSPTLPPEIENDPVSDTSLDQAKPARAAVAAVPRSAQSPLQVVGAFLAEAAGGVVDFLIPSAAAATPTGIDQGPGGPVLVVTPLASSGPATFGRYYAEILRNEGLNDFAVADLADDPLTASNLASYDVVVLAPATLTQAQVTALSDWVSAGGNLIAMRPDPKLDALLGISASGTPLADAYLLVDTASKPGAGIVGETIQYHGAADRYSLNGATAVATLYSDPTTATTSPAVTLRSVGGNGGEAAAFAFDLATSIVETRQGNPVWAAEERDGLTPIRSDDKFFGDSATDPQPDWTNLDKAAIPQADELQRFFANLVIEMNLNRKPLPRFWYFPHGKKAVVIMTGDDHANNGTQGRFDQFLAASPAGCSVADWECIRGTSYIYPSTPLSDADAAAYDAQGFEISLHVTTGCTDFTPAGLETDYTTQLAAFSASFPSLPAPVTERHHCLAWSDWATGAKVELSKGMRLDATYYYYPPSWVLDRPGFFNGSAMPMRFADLDGSMVDVYNAQTQMTDESGQTYPYTLDTLLDGALGPQGYFGAFTMNAHTDLPQVREANAVLASAPARGVPVVSARQMLTWLDGRNSSAFTAISWNGSALSFGVTVGSGARGLQGMLPVTAATGSLSGLTHNGTPVPYAAESIKGITYARFAATAGNYVATYGSGDTTAPTLTTRSPADGATGVTASAAVTATFSESLDPATVTSASFTLADGATPVAATVSYDDTTRTATLTPNAALSGNIAYTATVLGGGGGVKDLAGNPLAATSVWSFTTGAVQSTCATTTGIWSPSALPMVASANDSQAVELGLKFRPNVDGYVCGVRFYKDAGNGGQHVGKLWDSSGTLLAQATFTNETATGWQQVSFANPVAVTAGQLYVVSYHAPLGRYAADTGYFATSGIGSGVLYALSNDEAGGNGVYDYTTTGGFPSLSASGTNYWVDVAFWTDAAADTTPPSVVSRTPTDAATGVSPATQVSATFSESLDPASLTSATFTLASGGAPVAATVSYDGPTKTAILTPSAPLADGISYSATLVGGASGVKDLAGNPLVANATWSFTTGTTPTGCAAGTGLWGASATPAVVAENDAGAVELGVKFRPGVDGVVCGIRFYKGAGNTGAHVGTLWSRTGQLLAQAAFSNETASGWQQVDFQTPVAVTAGTLYVASYHAPAGHYAVDGGYFSTSGVTNGPLYAPASGENGYGGNGVYVYGASSSFPSSSWNSSNYWVDVVFSTSTGPDTTPPTVTGRTPADASTGVSVSAQVTATFSEALDPASVTGSTFTLSRGGTPVAATVSYDSTTNTATLVPSTALSDSIGYSATLVGGAGGIKDLAGNPLAANVTWSFTTGTQSSACSSPANPIVAENCLAGSPSSEWDVSGAGDPTIQGFATDISVNRGDAVGFKIDTDAADYRLDIYRMGYYGGDGARLVDSIQPSAVLPQSQPNCLTDATGLMDCGNWSLSASWQVPANATSGIYFARAVRTDTGGASHIFFIVRDDSSTSEVLFQTSDTTWQAYNDYGGNSFYGGTGPGTGGASGGRAYKLSYNRPFVTRSVDNGQDWVFNAEYPMVRWLESNGYDVSYFTGVDAARRGSLIQNHQLYLSIGHDEYWSGEQRTNVESARDAGVNMAFFSGNEVFWKTRWEASIDGSNTAYRTLVCYKETHNYPNNPDPQDPPTWTGTWRDPRNAAQSDGGQPENALTGTLFMVNAGATGSIQVPSEDGKMRFWRNTSIATLPAGQTATLPFGTLGYEWDEDIDNGVRPAGSIRLSTTTVANAPVLVDNGSTFGTGTAIHSLTLHRQPSGALVFGAGTVQWTWGLDSNHDRGSAGADPRMQQATVNLFADMGIQPATLQSGLAAATASSDTAAPSSSISAPATGANLDVGASVSISGTATDSGGGRVGGVEVSVDGGSTWHAASGRANWTYTWIPTSQGSYSIRSRAADDSANLEAPGAGVSVNVGQPPPPAGCTGDSLWPLTATPAIAAESDTASVELGVKFRPSQDGVVCGLRFYKGSGNTGTHVGSLWSASGTLLGTATFGSETATGWQQVDFASPIAVSANTLYVASYQAPVGRYAVDTGYFTSSGLTNGPLYALRDGENGGNGLYLYGAGGFPTNSFQGSNYWVDVVFQPGGTVTDTTPPTLTAQAPASGATGVALSQTVTATFSEPLDPATVTGTTFLLAQGGTPVPASVTYDSGTNTATLTPSAALGPSTPYTATLVGGGGGIKDLAGNPLSGNVSWSFTTGAGTTVSCATPQTLWSTSTTPGVLMDSDAVPIELGVKFIPAQDGFVCGVRFYKGTANSGTHLGSLWNAATGELLATATFSGETASGWQQVDFASPIPVTANSLYIASYHTQVGRYSVDNGYFSGSGVSSGSLYAPQDGENGGNGVYLYGATGFPTGSYQGSNYWVDVLFAPAAGP